MYPGVVLSFGEGVAKGTDLHPLPPSPQPLSRRERGFYDTLLEGEDARSS